MLSKRRSTLSWQKIGELRASKNLPLEEQFLESVVSRPGTIQIHSCITVMKLEVEIEAWKGLDLAQTTVSIFTFMSLICLISTRILQNKA
jgi:hypothetical protein